MTLKIKTGDKEIIQVNKEIGKLSILIKDLINDFDTEEEIELSTITSKQLRKIIHFCEIINYEPYSIPDQNKILPRELILNFTSKLSDYYDKLTQDDIVELLSISDFMNIPSLENICMIKLVEVFRSREKIKDFLGVDLSEEKISNNELLELKNKYLAECSVDHLSDAEVDRILETFELDYEEIFDNIH